ncbi:hypothetical protein E2C01_042226 [Portunus trituberculatus]|uniref:Uncharacterized protein n=1 Tax=Portunus trituberculatus TaxID=210409 RepID=A0A5B7FU14_PORTR|nr:hypothetical protein [Portunus trituberculatus]
MKYLSDLLLKVAAVKQSTTLEGRQEQTLKTREEKEEEEKEEEEEQEDNSITDLVFYLLSLPPAPQSISGSQPLPGLS